jgi:hypothetical protein
MNKDDRREALEEQELPSEELTRKESNTTLPKINHCNSRKNIHPPPDPRLSQPTGAKKGHRR